jgi:peroxiredoxin Q/BCP
MNFALPDQTGVVRELKDYAGRWLIVYFYPEDDTPGCTTEACGFRDVYEVLKEKGLAVVGISPDSVESHARFAKKYHFNFPVLSDESRAVMTAYGAWGPKKMWGKEYVGTTRKTMLVGPDGEIAKEYPKVNPLGHAEAILRDFERLAG